MIEIFVFIVLYFLSLFVVFCFSMRLKRIRDNLHRTLINFKVTDAELKIIKANAEKYAGGNLSEWVRYAATELTPRVKDIAK